MPNLSGTKQFFLQESLSFELKVSQRCFALHLQTPTSHFVDWLPLYGHCWSLVDWLPLYRSLLICFSSMMTAIKDEVTKSPLKRQSPQTEGGQIKLSEEHPRCYDPKICNGCDTVITDFYIMKVRLSLTFYYLRELSMSVQKIYICMSSYIIW